MTQQITYRIEPPKVLRGILVIALVALIVPGSRLAVAVEPAIHNAEEPGLQNGDFLVGVTVGQPTPTGVAGRIVRVRGGLAATFCDPVTGDANQPGYWNTPSDVLIDSQGRVVFLAYLHGNDNVPYRGFGLWRCDAMGATPTLLGAFGSDANLLLKNDPSNYPRPLGSRDVRFVGGLHLKRSKGLDLTSLTLTEAQFYVFAVADQNNAHVLADTIAYNPATGEWTESFERPVPTDQEGSSTSQFDMINANGYTFSVSGDSIRAFAEPLTLDFQIGDFTGGLAFQSLHDLSAAVIDDSRTPNTRESGCSDHGDGISLNYPNRPDGFTVHRMAGLFQLAWRDALILEKNILSDVFLPDVSLVLFDLFPENDKAAMFHVEGCAHQKKLDFTGWHDNPGSDSNKTGRDVARMTPDGTAGTQPGSGRVVSVGPSEDVAVLAEGLNNPTGIDVYPGFTPPLNGITFFTRIDSPVDVLITAADGRRIGVDPVTGFFVNDYGDAGYDSNTNEPHIYGIRDPLPGGYTIETKGTGTGPYTITTYGANLGTDVITRAIFTGSATPGSSSRHEGGLTSDGAVTNEDPVTDGDGDGVSDANDQCPNTPAGQPVNATGCSDATPPTTAGTQSPTPNSHGWNNTDVSVTLSAQDEPHGSGVKEIVYLLTEATSGGVTLTGATVAGASASVTASAEGTTTVTFFARDNAGNEEAPSTLTIRIDKTAPAVTGSLSPGTNAAGWNNSDVTLSFTCTDALSGIDTCTPPQVVTAEGADQSRTGTAVDQAGNSAGVTVGGINIDKTPPTLVCSADPSALWPPNFRLVTVTVGVAITDTLSGGDRFVLTGTTNNEPDVSAGRRAFSYDIQNFVVGTPDTAGSLRAERDGGGTGRIYSFTYDAWDRAGNGAACVAIVTVPHDQGRSSAPASAPRGR